MTVNAVHPGHVVTELGRDRPEDKKPKAEKMAARPKDASRPDMSKLPPPLPVEAGALTSIYVASSPEVEGVTGAYFDLCKAIEVTPVAADDTAARRLWEQSEKLIAGVAG